MMMIRKMAITLQRFKSRKRKEEEEDLERTVNPKIVLLRRKGN